MNIHAGTVGVLCRGVCAVLLSLGVSVPAKVVLVDNLLPSEGLGKVSEAAVSAAIETAARKLVRGDALVLPSRGAFGKVVLDRLPSDVQLIGGRGDVLVIRGLARGTLVFGGEYALNTAADPATLLNSTLIHTGSNSAVHNIKSAENVYWIDLLGAINVDGTMKNCTGVWMRYNHEQNSMTQASYSFKLNNSGQNVRILMMIEHNQGNSRPGLYVEQGNGIQFAGGSTEGCNGNPGAPYIYCLTNCTNVYVGHRRFFSNHRVGSSWYGKPPMSMVVGGKGNIIDNLVDIGNPVGPSLKNDDPELRCWSVLFEHAMTAPALFSYSVVTNSQPGIDQWYEPRVIDDEKVMEYNLSTGKVDLTSATTLPSGVTLPVPPRLPSCNIPKPADLLYKQAAGFGDDALNAGADPTGTKSSDAAFAAVLARKNILQLAPGRYRLERPLVLGSSVVNGTGAYQGRKIWIAGSGMGKTVIEYHGRGAVIVDGFGAGKAQAPVLEEAVVMDLTVSGGDYGYTITTTNAFQKNVEYKDYLIAGVYKPGGSQEQGRWISCTFDGGEYGWRLNGFSDKYLLYRCHFQNHSKGGIYCTEIANWQGGVFQSTFKNISGPGVALLGGGGNGYGPYCYRIDSCSFENCGSATEPVIHNGYGWVGAVSNCTITGTKAAVKGGFYGNFDILENLTFDLNTVNNVDLYLGHQRYEKTAGVGGSRLVNVKAKGAISFLPLSFMEELVVGANSGYNPSLYADKPWAFTYLFYKVNASNFPNTEYALVKDGEIEVDLKGFPQETIGTVPRPRAAAPAAAASGTRFDIRGRTLSLGSRAARQRVSGGVYLTHCSDGKVAPRLVAR